MVKVFDAFRHESAGYVPPNSVWNARKTGNLRIAYDSALRQQEVSSNDRTSPGPYLAKRLICVLLRFRSNPEAMSIDIKVVFFGSMCRLEIGMHNRCYGDLTIILTSFH